MGSIVNLSLGRLELDWGKNSFFVNHSALFAPDDIADAPYYYVDGIIERKPAFVRPLSAIVRRLDMMGYTLEGCKHRYQDAVDMIPSYCPPAVLTFDRFAKVMKRVDLEAVRVPEEEMGDDLGEVAREVFADPEFAKTEKILASVTRDDGTFFENLDPYVALRLLAENPNNMAKDVIWRYADVAESGWVDQKELYEGISESDRCLIVTEGSSDGTILRAALPIVAADVADFFDFVDMSENYPFSGTGNLFRFCQGLARIKVQNRILIVLDNDTAGHSALRRILALDLPSRMRVAVLPDLEECCNVRTLGPSGVQYEDINGRAVSIESFLDVPRPGDAEPVVRWTAYDEGMDAYQGELVDKDKYTRAFLIAVRRNAKHNWPKLEYLWNHLLVICTAANTPLQPAAFGGR